ncbi:MAG: tetratricopeptide repeat protein [Myxococcales bacterium]|nr:tetratricopeptide repeat protein [Myxococcales bacterium]MDH3486084.1 tetratricopeptide repeat protein [Myxococcales bacterium]
MANDPAENQKQAPLTPGQRLAAARAAKSARKAAERGRQAELVEDKALAQAAVAKDWLAENLKPLGLAAGFVLLVAAIGIAWSTFAKNKNETAGEELAAVLDSNIYDEAELAESYAAIVRDHEGTVAATWALIGEARALYGQGKLEQARDAYKAALEGTDDETLRWAALEGIAYTLEAEQSYDEALEQLEALRALSKEVAPIASYHQARILMQQGKMSEAKIKLRGVLADLRQPNAPPLPFTRAEAESRLAIIDPSQAPGTGLDMRGLQEQLNEMIRQQQSGQPAP